MPRLDTAGTASPDDNITQYEMVTSPAFGGWWTS